VGTSLEYACEVVQRVSIVASIGERIVSRSMRREGGVRRRDEGMRGARVRDEEKKGEEDLLGLR